jgi:ADP-ribose pyrophosphatase
MSVPRPRTPRSPHELREPKPRNLQAKLEVLSSRVVFRGPIFEVTRDQVREPNGVTAIREVIRHSGSVVILAVDNPGAELRVLLERQYRFAAKDYMLELPAGRIDPGESALTAGKRELREETGYTARKWKRVLYFYPSPGFLEESMTVFLASGLKAGKAKPEADERIDCLWLPLTEVVEMAMSGHIRDGKTLAGVLWLSQALNRQPRAS